MQAQEENKADVAMTDAAATSQADSEMQAQTTISTAAETSASGQAQSAVQAATADRDSDEEEKGEKKAFKGMQNQGATCYMNSMLQALYMTPEFRQMIYKFQYDPAINPAKPDCILYQLQKLFATLQIGKLPYAATTDLTTSFGWDTTQSFEQQDVQEFMRVLFDAIEKSFEQNKTYGVIDDLYMGVGSGYVKCSQCSFVSKVENKFADLQLPIKNLFDDSPPNESVEQALFKILLPETLEGDNAYQCSGCNNRVTAQKGETLDRLPKILTLQLQRFTLDMRTFNRKKLDDRVTFPLVLNMNHFLDQDALKDSEKLAELARQNPLNSVRPSELNVSFAQKKAEEEKAAAEAPGAQQAASAKPGTREARLAEQKRRQEEHKQNMARMKAAAKKRVGGFDRSKLNPNFAAGGGSTEDQPMEDSFLVTKKQPKVQTEEQKRDEAEYAKFQKQKKQAKKSLVKAIEAKNDQLLEQYLQDGPFVYELYAVMIHAGGALGGHYEAHIKDIESGKWYNFNDSIVREISVVEVVETFGPEAISSNVKNKAAAARRLASSRSNSAYMLMYRIIDKTEDRANLNVHDDEIPDEVRADVTLAEVATEKLVIEESKKSQKMQIKVNYKPSADAEAIEKQYVVDRIEDTYQTLFDRVYGDIIGNENSDKSKENFRLRAFNAQYSIMLDTYTGRENQTLQQLKIYPLKTLALEEKQPAESFEEYDPTMMTIAVNFWRSGLNDLSDEVLRPIQLKVSKEQPMSEFISLMVAQNRQLTGETWQESDLVVQRRNPLLNTSHLETLSTSPEKQLCQLRVTEGMNLFIENRTVAHPEGIASAAGEQGLLNAAGSGDLSKWEIEHELDCLRFQILFNTPKEAENQAEGGPDVEPESLDYRKEIYNNKLIVDRRITLRSLKEKISAMVGVGLDNLIFRKGGPLAPEILEDDLDLKQAKLYNLVCLFLRKGAPSVIGVKKVNFFIAKTQGECSQDQARFPDNRLFQFEDIGSLQCDSQSSVADIKAQLIEQLEPLRGLQPSQIRLREKLVLKLQSVLHDGYQFGRYSIHDEKEIAIQILKTDDLENAAIPIDLDCGYLILVRAWDPSTWALSDPVEIYVPKNCQLGELSEYLEVKFPQIKAEQMEAVTVPVPFNFSRIKLPFMQWQHLQEKNEGEDYDDDIEKGLHRSPIEYVPFYVQKDGTIFIIKDRTVEGREMTQEETELYKAADFENNVFFKPTQVVRTRIGADGQEMKVASQVEVGVKITVKGPAQAQEAAGSQAQGDSEMDGQ